MSLKNSLSVGFIPTKNAQASHDFYENILGLTFVSDDRFALVFKIGPEPSSMLRVVRIQDFTPLQFTIFGWEVDDIHATVAQLAAKGVEFLRFGFLEQDEHGVWPAPGGSQVAWFQDPDGNTLSLSHHASS